MDVIVKDPITGQEGTLNGGVSPTTEGTMPAGVQPAAGVGKVISGTLNNAITEEEVPDLLHTPFNRAVTIQGYPDTVFNQMFRKIGYRQIKAPVFGHFSIDQRKSADYTTEAANIVAADEAGTKVFKPTAVKAIKVADVDAFHVTDQITFKGIKGYDKNGKSHIGYYLNGYVCEIDSENSQIKVILINCNPNNEEKQALIPSGGTTPIISIPNGTEVLILGHALADEDSHVPPTQQIPEPELQNMQKFMTMASVTKVWQESEKKVDWGLADIKMGVTREFLLETEKTFLFGHKGYFKDPKSGKMIRTTGGLFEQLLEEGVEAIEIWEEELDDKSVISTMKEVFVGNRGSERRYMLTGMDFASALFSLESMQKQVNTNASKREYTYTWDIWKLFNYTIQNKPYALFDMLGFGNWAFVYDKSNIEYCVFRPMDEDMLDLDKLMIEDSDALRCCEISSMVLKYAKCHRLIIMHDGNSKAYDASTNPTGNPDGSRDKKRYAA